LSLDVARDDASMTATEQRERSVRAVPRAEAFARAHSPASETRSARCHAERLARLEGSPAQGNAIMTVLEFFPSQSYSIRRYTLQQDRVEIGQIDCCGVNGTASITIAGVTCTPVIDSALRGKYHLEANGARLADAQSAGFWFRYFNVQAGTKTYTLKMASWFGRRFALMENGTELGRIGVTSAFSGCLQGGAARRFAT
jgi:hypothetical protein